MRFHRQSVEFRATVAVASTARPCLLAGKQHERAAKQIERRHRLAAAIDATRAGAREPGRPFDSRGCSCVTLAGASSLGPGHNGGRSIEVAELDVEIVGERLEVLLPRNGAVRVT